MFAWLQHNRQVKAQAQHLYAAIVRQMRQEPFYRAMGVPDTFDGRFDLLVLLTHLVLRRLRSEGGSTKTLAQALFDALIADMDAVLREIGVGDTSVGKKVRAMAAAFYGRGLAYDEALAKEGTQAALEQALARNVIGDPAAAASQIADYILRLEQALQACPVESLMRADIPFPLFAGAAA